MRKENVKHLSNLNSELGYGKNLKMNDSLFKLRKKAIKVIYELKKLNPDLPRIDVRITDKPLKSNHTGLALIDGNIIWLPIDTFNYNDLVLYEVIAHEVVHAATGFLHDENCPLMSATHSLKKPLTKEVVNKCFIKYFK